MDQAGTLRSIVKKRGVPGSSGNESMDIKGELPGNEGNSPVQVISVTSGKGGVGKTNVVANLGYALTRLNKRVLVLDADVGLANMDVILGLSPKYNLQHVLNGEKTIS